jgi:predicted permease
MWTVGMWILRNQLDRRWWVAVCNPVAISIVIALILKLTGLWSHVPARRRSL